MFLMVSNPRKRANSNYLADFISPRSIQYPETPVWAADNDCFNGFNPDRWLRMLDILSEAPYKPVFVTIPDVVGNHEATLEMWHEWKHEAIDRGLDPAFVLQNGCELWSSMKYEHDVLPTDASCYFVGGDTSFKFSEGVRDICATPAMTADGIAPWFHMGRVNSVKRLKYARDIGCHSVDGSGMARFTTSVLLPMIDALKRWSRVDQFEFSFL